MKTLKRRGKVLASRLPDAPGKAGDACFALILRIASMSQAARKAVDSSGCCLRHPWIEEKDSNHEKVTGSSDTDISPTTARRNGGYGRKKMEGCDTLTLFGDEPSVTYWHGPLKGAVKQISGSVGNAVDCVEMQLRTGKKHFYGTQGGFQHKSWRLHHDEVILAVAQEERDSFVGNSVVFYTSECQIIALQGHDATNRTRLIAPIGSQISGLQFEGSQLTGIYLERVPFDGSPMAVSSIIGHVGSAVDKLVLRLRDGSTRRYGFEGGYQCGPYNLDDDEYILLVEQDRRDAYLGNSIAFVTSKGKIWEFRGMQASRSRRFVAPPDRQICGLFGLQRESLVSGWDLRVPSFATDKTIRKLGGDVMSGMWMYLDHLWMQHDAAHGMRVQCSARECKVLHFFEQYLEYRQLQKNRESAVPEEFQGIVDEAKFLESQAYQKDKRLFGFVKDWVSFIFDKVQLFLITPWLWHYAVSVFGEEAEYSCTLFFLFLLQWVEKPISIPFSLYSNFVVEEKHGFNKMTVKLFVTDLIKSEILTYVFGGLLVPMLIWIVRYFGAGFYLYLWGFVQCLMMAFMWIYPNLIQPLFNEFKTLQDLELKEKIEALAAEVSFPLTKLFQIDGSKRSGHSNAYFFGFWKYKRIVLYDTLLHLKHDDILAILCHELGHWKFGHTLMNLVIASAHTFVLFWLFDLVMYSEVSSQMVKQFGYGETNAVMVSLMLFMLLVSPTEQLLSLLMTMLSRRNEFQADSFAAKMGKSDGLQSGLFQIHEENKGDLNPDPLYSWYHFSHPPLVERLRALKAIEAESAKKVS
ncbi:unnamed protein product [Cladocopium goreaui]|uniref:Ste24 endopeptidase n=1 Tax=Cladocopium goreaui TaxID=2562237 RepID=A0A9P1BLW1_9DINO|nr:unnamed protein product [Cladocopium goreaui]